MEESNLFRLIESLENALTTAKDVQREVTELRECVDEDFATETQYMELQDEVEALRAENEMLRTALEKLLNPLATEAVLEGIDLDIAQRCFPLS